MQTIQINLEGRAAEKAAYLKRRLEQNEADRSAFDESADVLDTDEFGMGISSEILQKGQKTSEMCLEIADFFEGT